MSTYTKKDMLKEIKAYCKNLGFTFKVNDRKLINNEKCYKLVKRYTDDVIIDKFGNDLSNFTLDTGYENMQSGYFDMLAQDEIINRLEHAIKKELKNPDCNLYFDFHGDSLEILWLY